MLQEKVSERDRDTKVLLSQPALCMYRPGKQLRDSFLLFCGDPEMI